MFESSTTVAPSIVRCLQSEGVRCIFSIPGEGDFRRVDADTSSSTRFILAHHEQSAAFEKQRFAMMAAR